MSATIKAAITALKGRIAAAYSAISAKGGTLPATQDSDNLASAIASIPSGGGGSQYTGHIDEVGLRAIGWIDRDIEWFSSLIDWNADEDNAYKVPQELIDAYVAAGSTWSEALTSSNSANWWFRYRPRGGEGGSQFGVNSYCPFLIAIPNYETWPFPEMRAIYNSLKGIVINNPRQLQNCNFWGNASPVMWFNTSTPPIDGAWGWFRNNNNIREIHGVIDLVNQTTPINSANYCFTQANILQVIWIKNLKTNLRIPTATIRKECVLYIINNEAATGAITFAIGSAAYSQYSTDADVLAALANHPNISLISA